MATLAFDPTSFVLELLAVAEILAFECLQLLLAYVVQAGLLCAHDFKQGLLVFCLILLWTVLGHHCFALAVQFHVFLGINQQLLFDYQIQVHVLILWAAVFTHGVFLT